MDIRNIRELKNTAAQRMEQAGNLAKIVLIYTLISVGASLLVTVVTYCLELQIDQYGGLSHIGTRSILATLSTVLPIVQSMAMMCLELGFIAAMIRISRGLYTSEQTLRAGMPRFWAMLRSTLMLFCIYFVAAVAGFYLATMIFVMTPLANGALELLIPLATAADPTALILEEAVELQLMQTMIPLFVLFGIIYALLVIPLSYRFRMVNYVLMHDPRAGAFTALRRSGAMMRGNCLALLKVDLSLWWYYALSALAMVVCYGDWILPALGVDLPVSPEVSFFLFYGLSLAAVFGINYCFRGRVGVIYALVFESIRPREEENSGGVVLGNIFKM